MRAQVSRLRRNLHAGLIEFHGTGYRLAIDPEDVDVHRFERLAREGRRLVSAGHHAAAAGLLREALDLWRGPALTDLPFRQAQAAWLEELRLAATEDLIEAELALPEGGSVAELRRLVAAHPLRERLSGQLMLALQATGRQAEASTGSRRPGACSPRSSAPTPRPSPPRSTWPSCAPSGLAPRQRLAAQFTSFVGRERELERLDALRDARLITLVGPGGMGKTGSRSRPPAVRRREVCFVDLSPLDDGGPGAPGGARCARAARGRLPALPVTARARPRATPGVGCPTSTQSDGRAAPTVPRDRAAHGRGAGGVLVAERAAQRGRGGRRAAGARPGLEEEYVACVLHAVPTPRPSTGTRAERSAGDGRPLRHPFLAPLWGMSSGRWASRPTRPLSVATRGARHWGG